MSQLQDIVSYFCCYQRDELVIEVNVDMFHILSEGGLFKAHLYFPKEYPHRPPKMRFISEFWHPNGEFVIRIL